MKYVVTGCDNWTSLQMYDRCNQSGYGACKNTIFQISNQKCPLSTKSQLICINQKNMQIGLFNINLIFNHDVLPLREIYFSVKNIISKTHQPQINSIDSYHQKQKTKYHHLHSFATDHVTITSN